jgi:hypothetical protein
MAQDGNIYVNCSSCSEEQIEMSVDGWQTVILWKYFYFLAPIFVVSTKCMGSWIHCFKHY